MRIIAPPSPNGSLTSRPRGKRRLRAWDPLATKHNSNGHLGSGLRSCGLSTGDVGGGGGRGASPQASDGYIEGRLPPGLRVRGGRVNLPFASRQRGQDNRLQPSDVHPRTAGWWRGCVHARFHSVEGHLADTNALRARRPLKAVVGRPAGSMGCGGVTAGEDAEGGARYVT